MFTEATRGSTRACCGCAVFLANLAKVLTVVPTLCFCQESGIEEVTDNLVPTRGGMPLSVSRAILLLLTKTKFTRCKGFLVTVLRSFVGDDACRRDVAEVARKGSLLVVVF